MTLSEVGRAGQLVDPLNGGDVAADGTLLSVAQIQARFREELEETADHEVATDHGVADDHGVAAAEALVAAAARQVETAAVGTQSRDFVRAVLTDEVPSRGDRASGRPTLGQHGRVAGVQPASGGVNIPVSWVRVLAGHSGAGSSTVALALADAAASTGRASQVIEAAAASRSGLVSAASRELDVDESGSWRRGLRPHGGSSTAVTITRRADDQDPSGWPTSPAKDELLVVDLGLVPADAVANAIGGPMVVVCRATIPGVRLTEQLLDRITDATVVAAVLGGRRWPGEVTASAGPRLRALRDTHQVVTVPLDAHLTVTGPTHLPLPRAVLAAGRVLLGLIDATRQGTDASSTSASAASRTKGTPR